jgi:hypothetical protein
LCWLPDIARWAQVAASFVKPGGFFYMAEFHPLTQMSRNDAGATKLEFEISYFHTAMREDPPGPDYSDHTKIVSETHQWMYRIGDVVSALAAAGLRIEYLHEHAECIYQHAPFMKQSSDGLWHIEGDPIPTIFSIKATKP